MQVSISSFNLGNWYRKDPIVPGMKVCPCNGVYSIGTIIELGPVVTFGYNNQELPEFIKVLWGTGKKRGKITIHKAANLADLHAYIACCQGYLNGYQKLIDEANTLGM